ncbi:hypothetical protein Bcp1_167 [Bacillus phage Bcp1]|uniref:Uncharacterized protein n=1 Tax=Bacillus phage Bcp1 TaxID=584892 RepID=X2JN01_9CAUD|nr:hypothetical protein Bcp1_167 [Bacillus phage Bcp1]AHN66642.1 hypothetical protein Bcp1_167 [Bacillus phage Bcp1]
MALYIILTLIGLYIGRGIVTANRDIVDVKKQLTLYQEGRFKEVDDEAWEAVKDINKIADVTGNKFTFGFMYVFLVLVSPFAEMKYYLSPTGLKEIYADYKMYKLKKKLRKYKNGTLVEITNPQEKDYEWDYEGEWEKHKGWLGKIVDYFPPSEEHGEREAYEIKFEGVEDTFEYEPDEFTITNKGGN